MVNGLLGKKIGMTQVYSEDGKLVPVTVIQAGPCSVLQIKTEESDGYSSVKLGFLNKKKKSTTKAEIGFFDKANVEPKSFVREVNSEKVDDLKLGQEITVDIFEKSSIVDISGVTIGKGFAGCIKRWGFSGGPGAHGSTVHRRPGSAGPGTNPGRVIKGRKMPGRLGNKNKSIRNLNIVKIDKSLNLMLVKGAVPGAKGSCLLIRKIDNK